MKDYALQLAAARTGYNEKLNCLREYLQAYIMRILFDDGFFNRAAFVGGTALRFLHQLPRYSEDLDFSLIGKEKQSLETVALRVKRELELSGYEITVKHNDRRTVRYATIGFSGLLFEAGLSPHRGRKLSIKIELDTRPPAGAALATHIGGVHFPLAYTTYGLPSLFAGKITALLSRDYTKGRDYFDLGWYLSRWPELRPNLELLNNGLRQAGVEGFCPAADDWRTRLSRVVETADWEMVRKDASPFLERAADLNIYTRDNLLRLLAPGE